MRAIALVLLCGCSFEHGKLPGAGSNAPDGGVDPDGDRAIDAGLPCTLGPWGTPQPISELNGGSLDAMPRLTTDERIVVFHSVRAGGSGQRDLWMATRSSSTGTFGAPVPLTALNSAGNDRDPAISADGLQIVYASTSAGGEHDLYHATRASTSDAFGTPQPVTAVNTGGREYFTSLSADGLTLCFSADRSGAYDIFYVTRANTAVAFTGTPQAFAGLNTSDYEYGLTVSADGLEAYVSAGYSTVEIRRATRASTADTFSTPVAVPELNASTEQHPGWLSPDRKRFYFTSYPNSEYTIYLVTRSCM